MQVRYPERDCLASTHKNVTEMLGANAARVNAFQIVLTIRETGMHRLCKDRSDLRSMYSYIHKVKS